MKLENQVTSLEISKKLKELGVKQENLFYWQTYKKQAPLIVRSIRSYSIYKGDYFSAFTVAELGEMLPFRSKKMGTINDAMLVCRKSWSGNASAWQVYYEDEDNGVAVTPRFWDNSEADARGKMLIYLIENKLISPN